MEELMRDFVDSVMAREEIWQRFLLLKNCAKDENSQ
jgi:hypothetical protein